LIGYLIKRNAYTQSSQLVLRVFTGLKDVKLCFLLEDYFHCVSTKYELVNEIVT